jgi:uncharacterized protein (DUF2164 family)
LSGRAEERKLRAVRTCGPEHGAKIPAMTIEIPREARAQAIASIERYFRENMEEKIGNIAAGALLGFFIEEVGPLIYNQAVTEVQERLQTRVMEIDLEVHEAPFQYWRKYDQAKQRR